ncbi:hypothetical protein GW17_00033416 [Ensete ventricosum]|nr:hypothetical protein GW17_00033416 [Ensete ventricosum]
MGFAQLVIGPAGSGKVKFLFPCWRLNHADLYSDHCFSMCHLLSRSQLTVLAYINTARPWEGLFIYIFRNLEDSLDHWLADELDNYLDDDYLVFDCPGNITEIKHIYALERHCQIELFTHVPVLRNFVDHLKGKNFNLCAVYLLDSQVCPDYLKAKILLSELNKHMAPRFANLNKALAELIDDYNMVNFIPLNLRKESRLGPTLKTLIIFSLFFFSVLLCSIQYVLSCIDNCIQYGEDSDVKIKDFDPDEDD